MADQDREQTTDEELPTGMPEGEDDATPLGVDGDAEPPAPGEDAMPGIAKEDEPEVSG